MSEKKFDVKLHLKYLVGLKNKKKDFESCMTEHMRISGIYWGVGAMALLGKEQHMGPEEIIQWVMQCQHSDGGFSGNIGHDAHLLYTVHALLILAMLNGVDRVNQEKCAKFVASLQQPDGSFAGDKWLEIDTKFTYCALSCLSILKRTDLIDIPKAMAYINTCKNFDGGFGNIPGRYHRYTSTISYSALNSTYDFFRM
jgi:geranylgeranyl transferase type-2 subunit beta